MVFTVKIDDLPNVGSPPLTENDIHSTYGTNRRIMARGQGGRIWVIYWPSSNIPRVKYSDDNGATWITDHDFTTFSGTDATQIALDQNDLPHIIWANGTTVRYSRRMSDGSWTTPTSITVFTSINEQGDLAMCLDGNGFVHFLVFENSTASNAPKVRYYTNLTGSFVETETVFFAPSGTGTCCHQGVIVCDKLNNLHIVIGHRDTGGPGDSTQKWLYGYKRRAVGATIGEFNNLWNGGNAELILRLDLSPGPSEQEGIFRTNHINIAVDDSNGVHVIIGSDFGVGSSFGARKLHYLPRPATGYNWLGSSDDGETIISDPSALFWLNHQIVISKSGVVKLFAERRATSGATNSVLVQLTGTGTWTQSVLINNPAEYIIEPQVCYHVVPSIGFSGGIPKAGAIGCYMLWRSSSDSDLMFFRTDDWDPNDGSDITDEGPPAYADETNFASIPLTGEGFPILIYPFKYELVFPYTDRYASEIELMDSGWEVRWPRVALDRRQFVVRQNAMTQSEKDQLDTFLASVSGPLYVFWLTIVDPAEGIKVRIVQDAVPVTKISDGVYVVEFLVEEVL